MDDTAHSPQASGSKTWRTIGGAVIVCGVAGAAWVSSPEREVWDGAEYWVIWLPVFFCAVLSAQVLAPAAIWVWPLLISITQVVVMTALYGLGAFLLVGLLFLGILGLPNVLAALIGSFIAKGIQNARSRPG